jgi:hypothetical protein
MANEQKQNIYMSWLLLSAYKQFFAQKNKKNMDSYSNYQRIAKNFNFLKFHK